MKRGFFIVLAITVVTQALHAQTIKTGVLVIGNRNNAIGAGIQSAVSGVKTILMLPVQSFDVRPLDKDLPSGIAAEFVKRYKELKGIKDGSALNIDDANANTVLKIWTDSLKNLTVIRGLSISRLKRSGSGWNVQLNDGRTIKAKVLVNADHSGQVNTLLGLQKTGVQWQPFNYINNLYRTAFAAGYSVNNTTANVMLLKPLLPTDQENLVVLSPETESFAAGQAAGATAAYAVFFNSKTSAADLKTIQRELINYKLCLVPFADINYLDSNWKAIQFVGLSGFLKGEVLGSLALFYPDKEVSVAEIKEPIKEYYYKAQIWFDDYKAAEMTLGATLDLVCKVGNKSLVNTEAEIKKRWKANYNFKTEFNAARPITRREFAVIVNEYLKPFDVTIDKSGRVLR